MDDKPFLPSKVFDLQDTKSAQSLAQIYEGEYTAARSGGSTDDRDGKLQREYEDLEKMWENISSKLDALCNAHFTPKAVSTELLGRTRHSYQLCARRSQRARYRLFPTFLQHPWNQRFPLLNPHPHF